MKKESGRWPNNLLHDKIQELEIELEDSNTDREKEIIVNQVDTLKCVLDHLFNLKYGEKVPAIEITEANQQAQRRSKIQDVELPLKFKISISR